MEIKRFTIDGQTYKVEPMAPLDAVKFGLKVARAIGPLMSKAMEAEALEQRGAAFLEGMSHLEPEQTEEILRESYNHVYTPTNECLENLAAFNQWFQKYPGHMFEVGLRSTWLLASDFLPESLKSMLSGLSFPQPGTPESK